ncbi:Cystathionine [Rhizoctonia solani]|uniref:Cystathionine beta-lyase n=1 Tax=Rhizoctonia solani TaxID=456999 RepID=A0A8H7HEU3_9AGAM|nr:Cystathionine [Rhizoctonia solani]
MSSSPPYTLETPVPDSPSVRRRRYHFSTQCATVENPEQKDQYGSSSVPIYQTATFKGMGGAYDYSRSGNPTRSHLEHHLAKISSARHAFAVSSGMAALDIITRLLKPGDEVIAGDDLYGGTNRLLNYLRTHSGVVVHHVDTTNPDSLRPVLSDKTALVLLESPTNPLLKIADLAYLASSVTAQNPNALVVVDNTMMSPYLQRPLEHGAHIVYDSGTKYLSGHHDLMAGVIVCNRDDIAKQIAFTINSVGNALAPVDAFLLLRGIKTLAIRMDRQQATARLVASHLQRLGFQVFYPGLADHPNRIIHEKIASGPGAVLSFVTGDKSLSERIVGATRLWGISVSFGAVNSLISMPCLMSHASIDSATRAARGLPEDLIRLCVGIEDPTDLIDDLDEALLDAGAVVRDSVGNYVRVRNGEKGMIGRAVEKLGQAVEGIGLTTGLEPNPAERPWLVSAPGKVILFGEHAVVHGVTAIAASVDLRCYAFSTPLPPSSHTISLTLSDLDSKAISWDTQTLPWEAATTLSATPTPFTLDAKLVAALEGILDKQGVQGRLRNASLAFLYLYMSMSGDIRPTCSITTRSALPIGAGLGSSASYSTTISLLLLLLTSRLSLPSEPAPTSDSHLHISHAGRRALTQGFAAEVNAWAFIAETVLHGNPSGVDNTVAVFGGGLGFTRDGFGERKGVELIPAFKSIRFLLTDSQVPRDTKKLVAGVGQMKADRPALVTEILNRIQAISDEAQRALGDPELERGKMLAGIEALMDENHGHLVTLGVSHPVLEQIKNITAKHEYGLHTKLTGAGGGGCAVTLIPDDFSESKMTSLINDLRSAGFVPYNTAVGGSGLGVFHPHAAQGRPGPAEQTSEAGEAFSKVETGDLAAWAEGVGRWLYV